MRFIGGYALRKRAGESRHIGGGNRALCAFFCALMTVGRSRIEADLRQKVTAESPQICADPTAGNCGKCCIPALNRR